MISPRRRSLTSPPPTSKQSFDGSGNIEDLMLLAGQVGVRQRLQEVGEDFARVQAGGCASWGRKDRSCGRLAPPLMSSSPYTHCSPNNTADPACKYVPRSWETKSDNLISSGNICLSLLSHWIQIGCRPVSNNFETPQQRVPTTIHNQTPLLINTIIYQ